MFVHSMNVETTHALNHLSNVVFLNHFHCSLTWCFQFHDFDGTHEVVLQLLQAQIISGKSKYTCCLRMKVCHNKMPSKQGQTLNGKRHLICFRGDQNGKAPWVILPSVSVTANWHGLQNNLWLLHKGWWCSSSKFTLW